MSSPDSEDEESHKASPIVADTKVYANKHDTQPTPVPDDEFTEESVQDDERAKQSREMFESDPEPQAGTESLDETLESQFSDSSGESPVQSPVAPQEKSEEELYLWFDEDDGTAPPPRPAARPEPSAHEAQKPQHELMVDRELEDDTQFNYKTSKGHINNHKIADRGLPTGVARLPKDRRGNKDDGRWTPGPSALHLVTRPSSPASASMLLGIAAMERQAPRDDPASELADDSESNQAGYEPNAEAVKLAGIEQAGRSVDDPTCTVQEASNVTLRADSHQARQTTPEPQRQRSRPASPITGFHDQEDADNYYELRDEFDALTKDQRELSSESEGRPHVVKDGETSETPPAPTSAEILEEVTGTSLKDGKRRFERLAALADTRVMQNPQRALEMKRQMLLYLEGMQNARVFSTNEEGAKVKAKAKAAWSSAAAHHYRDGRERFKQSANEWENYAKVQLSWAQKYESEMKSADQAAQVAQEESYYLQQELYRLQEEKRRWRGVQLQIEPLWQKRQERIKNGPPKDAETQTSPNLSPTKQAASPQQTAKVPDQGSGNQSEDETNSSSMPKVQFMGTTIDSGTQTAPQTANDEPQRSDRSSARNAQATIPLLRFDIDSDVRPNLVPKIVNWIREAHQRHRGDPSVQPVTNERIESLVDHETTYADFVSALERDGFLFRPDHLAYHIERVINEASLGAIPLAILQNIFRIDLNPRSLQRDLTTIYDQIAQRQDEINRLRAYNFQTPMLNSDEEAMEALRADRAATEADLINSERNFRQATADIHALERRNSALARELAESEATVAELAHDRTTTPSQSSEKSEMADAKSEQADRLKDDLKACRKHGKQIQKSLDDADSEKKKLQVNLQACHKHGEELKAANEQLSKDVAHWRRTFEEMEATNLKSVQQIINLQVKCDELPEGLSDDSDKGKNEDDEVAKLRAEVERLKAENDRLTAAGTRPPNEEIIAFTGANERFQPLIEESEEENDNLTNENQLLKGENIYLQANQQGAALTVNSAELEALKRENQVLKDRSVRYNTMCNLVAAANEKAQKKTTTKKNLTVSTNLPLRSMADTNHMSPPSATALPVTPAQTTGTTPSAGNSLLRPSDGRDPVLLTPVDAATMPAHWLTRERRLQNTLAFQQTRSKVYQMIEERDQLMEEEEELREEKRDVEAKVVREQRQRAERPVWVS